MTLPQHEIEYMKKINEINEEFNQKFCDTTSFRRKPQYCLECGKLFTFISHLERHKEKCINKAGEDDSPAVFKCNVCPKTFPIKHNLIRHKKSVHCNSKYTCKKCKILFSRSDVLGRHRRQRKCNTCSKTMECLTQFKKHVLSHKDKKNASN